VFIAGVYRLWAGAGGRTTWSELRGASKEEKSICHLQVIGALKAFGHVWVNLGQPIKLAEFLDSGQPD
jgi:glycerol-3-phosphate O-acyltransferase